MLSFLHVGVVISKSHNIRQFTNSRRHLKEHASHTAVMATQGQDPVVHVSRRTKMHSIYVYNIYIYIYNIIYTIVIQWQFAEYGLYIHETRRRVCV